MQKMKKAPDSGEPWLSLSPNLEFQPAKFVGESAGAMKDIVHRMLQGTTTYTNEYELQFVDGTETYYNDYAQAWRLLGFYIDCNSPRNNYNECRESGDRGEEDSSSSSSGNYYYYNNAPCQRYLMWAGYVDLNYAGGGIGEYQFYDRSTDSWNATSCVAANGRCAKMDCHLHDTEFSLLGFFKEPNYHEWMEQLFKHQGVCLWNDEQYEFMQVDRELWPCDCTNTYTKDEEGNYLYYDTKPFAEGRIGLGLYTDSRCSVDYSGSLDVVDVIEGYISSDYYEANDRDSTSTTYDLAENLASWNDAFDVFKVCQPCKAYNLGYNSDLNNGQQRQGGDDSSDDTFDCYDDADYKSVNQCMKFRTKTEMLTADFRDIMLADQQGTIVQVEVMGSSYGQGGYGRSSTGTGGTKTQFSVGGGVESGPGREQYAFFAVALLVFSLGVILSVRVFRRGQKSSLRTPLVGELESEFNNQGVIA